jgi:hypothetical protein
VETAGSSGSAEGLMGVTNRQKRGYSAVGLFKVVKFESTNRQVKKENQVQYGADHLGLGILSFNFWRKGREKKSSQAATFPDFKSFDSDRMLCS